MIRTLNKAIFEGTFLKKNPLNLGTFLISKKRLTFFSTTFTLNSSDLDSELKRSQHSSELNVSDFSSFKKDENLVPSTENIAFLSKAAFKKTLIIKELDWTSLKLKPAGASTSPKLKKTVRSTSNNLRNSQHLKIEDRACSEPIAKGVSTDLLEVSKAKQGKVSDISDYGRGLHLQRFEWKRKKRLQKEKSAVKPWLPVKRISRASMDKIRSLAEEMPKVYTLTKLAAQFKIPSEAVKRILKSKFKPTSEIIEHQDKKRKQQRQIYLKSLEKSVHTSLLTSDAPNFFTAPLSLRYDSRKNPHKISSCQGSPRKQYDAKVEGELKTSTWIPTGENEGWDNL